MVSIRPAKSRAFRFGAPMATSLTSELRLQVGQAKTPAAGVDQDGMRTHGVAAADQQPARAAERPHFPESDFLLAAHGALKFCQESHPRSMSHSGC
jgi:hypothetical protein